MIKYRVWDNTEQKYDYGGYACNFSHFGEIEVMGNVHEHAELLEETK